MRKIFCSLLVIFMVHAAFAECVSVSSVTKCAKIPSYFSPGMYRPGTFTSNSWDLIYYDWGADRELCYWSGDYAELQSSSRVRCDVTYPFKMTLLIDMEHNGLPDNAYKICATYLRSMVFSQMLNISKLPDDKCPDGFYTVPYEISCGTGFVDTADIPNCDEDTTGDFCVIQSMIPCASGINKLSTSVGASIPLWAEKYTHPAMHVLYNGVMCYGNLSPGRESNTINIQIDNQVYHLGK